MVRHRIGQTIQIRLNPLMLQDVDDMADEYDVSRAEMLRLLIGRAVDQVKSDRSAAK